MKEIQQNDRNRLNSKNTCFHFALFRDKHHKETLLVMMVNCNLLQQLIISKAEGFLQHHRQHNSKDEEAFLLSSIFLVTDLNRDEPHQRGQEERHQPEEGSERKTTKTYLIQNKSPNKLFSETVYSTYKA